MLRTTTAASKTAAPGTTAPKTDDVAVGRRVLLAEAAGLNAVAEAVDGAFTRAVELMRQASGRVVVSGMGKSGHVGRKIAATLASTGTPSQYVNAGETSHGDLGMITKGDVVLVLSNSGETAELSDLVAHTRLRDIPLIAIAGRLNSTLVKAADVSLVLPDLTEACPFNLAPTTSTTAMMALGDALAIALLERQGFSAEDFSALHPGGRLGKRFIKVRDLMHPGDAMPLATPDSLMRDALLVMTAKRFGCIGIVDDCRRLIGIITDGDLRRHMETGLLERTAGEVMTLAPRAMNPDTLAATALRSMNERKITALFVVENGVPVGVLHIHDLLRAGLG